MVSRFALGLARRTCNLPLRMNNEIRWLARLGIDAGLFTRGHITSLATELGPKAEMMDVAQELIDEATRLA